MYSWLVRCTLWVISRYLITMFAWISKWVWWFLNRSAITLACIYVLQMLLHSQGYFVKFNILLTGAVCLILGVAVWLRPPSPEKSEQEITWSDKV